MTLKNILLPFTFFLLVSSFYQCKQSVAPVATINGDISGSKADSFKIFYFENYWAEDPKNLWVGMDSSGRFTATLRLNSFKECRIYVDNKYQANICLKPGWQTTFNLSISEQGEKNAITFEGDAADENDVFNAAMKLINYTQEQWDKEPDQFFAFFDSVEQVLKADVENLKNADHEFVTMIRNDIDYYMMMVWKSYYTNLKPDSLFHFINRYEPLQRFDDAELLNSMYYKSMLVNYFSDLSNIVTDNIDYDAILEANNGDVIKTNKDHQKISLNLKLDLADSIISNPEIKNFIYYDALLGSIGLHSSVKALNEVFEGRFKDVVTDTFMINNVGRKILNQEKLSPGMPAPTFSYPDTAGIFIKLTDFKGKPVYIDVWATWCGPCLAQLPKLRELEKEFGDKIAFISISVDEKRETWKNFIRDRKLSGIQLHSPKGGQAEIRDLYVIQGIPRFILIDPEGKIIDVNASRPSSDKTRKLFEALTNKSVDHTKTLL